MRVEIAWAPDLLKSQKDRLEAFVERKALTSSSKSPDPPGDESDLLVVEARSQRVQDAENSRPL